MCARKKNSRKHCQSLNGSMDRALIAAWPHQSVIISMRTTEQPFDTKPVGSSAPVAMIPIFYTQHSECFRLLSAVAAPSCFVRGLCPSLSLSFSRSIFSSFPLFLTNARATTLADNVRSCFLLLFIRTSSATPSTALVVPQSLCRGRLASRHHRPRRLRLWPHIRSSTRAHGPSYHAIAPMPPQPRAHS